ALLYNSGYMANIGLWASIAKKNDVILYDEFIHASARDGIRLSYAQSFSFKHNDITSLEKKLSGLNSSGNVFIATESIYSMDGDMAPLKEIATISEKWKAN